MANRNAFKLFVSTFLVSSAIWAEEPSHTNSLPSVSGAEAEASAPSRSDALVYDSFTKDVDALRKVRIDYLKTEKDNPDLNSKAAVDAKAKAREQYLGQLDAAQMFANRIIDRALREKALRDLKLEIFVALNTGVRASQPYNNEAQVQFNRNRGFMDRRAIFGAKTSPAARKDLVIDADQFLALSNQRIADRKLEMRTKSFAFKKLDLERLARELDEHFNNSGEYSGFSTKYYSPLKSFPKTFTDPGMDKVIHACSVDDAAYSICKAATSEAEKKSEEKRH